MESSLPNCLILSPIFNSVLHVVDFKALRDKVMFSIICPCTLHEVLQRHFANTIFALSVVTALLLLRFEAIAAGREKYYVMTD